MDIVECVRKRKSIRGYKKDPVPQELIKKILEISTRAPSGLNTQPWEFLVVEGEVLNNIRKENVERYSSGEIPNPMFDYKNEGVYYQRQIQLARQLFVLLNINREDHEKRNEWLKKGLRFFDAPTAIIVTMDRAKSAQKMALFDLGIITQTICLVAFSYGLGTCIEIQGVFYPEVIRKCTGLPESKQIIMGISIGYPDWDFPANQIKTDRVPIDEILSWREFDIDKSEKLLSTTLNG